MNSKEVSIIGCFVIFAFSATTAETVIPKLYEEIGCKEVNASSPTRFECPDFTTYASDKCYYGGKTYNVDDDISDDDMPSCRAACRCVKYDNETASIVCANVECPENFGLRNWNCTSVYDNLKQCCRSREICDQAKMDQLQKCEVEGKSYRVGEEIYPDGESCYKCLCAEGYDNKTTIAENPHCEKINCGIELNLTRLKDGCIPIYYKTASCCPIDYKCPSKSDAVEASPSGEKLSCKYGDLTFGLGQTLKTDEKCLKCECSTPPFLTCIKSNDC